MPDKKANIFEVQYLSGRHGLKCGGHKREGGCVLPGEICRPATFPGVFGAVANAYSDKYGANREHLMNITIKSHLNAPLNPSEAQESYCMSGFTPKDIQFAEVHDCFSIAELLHIEDLGFFKPGEGFMAVAEGQTRRYGSKPINNSGGLKCKGHPVRATGTSQLYEVRTQLRGKAGKRQVPINDLRIGGAHNLGGTGGTSTFTIMDWLWEYPIMPHSTRIDAAGAVHHIITIAPPFMMAQGYDRKPIKPHPLCSYGIILA